MTLKNCPSSAGKFFLMTKENNVIRVRTRERGPGAMMYPGDIDEKRKE